MLRKATSANTTELTVTTGSRAQRGALLLEEGGRETETGKEAETQRHRDRDTRRERDGERQRVRGRESTVHNNRHQRTALDTTHTLITQTHKMDAFGPHDAVAGGRQVGQEIELSAVVGKVLKLPVEVVNQPHNPVPKGHTQKDDNRR